MKDRSGAAAATLRNVAGERARMSKVYVQISMMTSDCPIPHPFFAAIAYGFLTAGVRIPEQVGHLFRFEVGR